MGLLPPKITADPDKSAASLVLLFVLLSNMVMSLGFIPILFFSFERSPIMFEFGLPAIFVCIACYVVAYFLLTRLGWAIMAGNIAQVGIYVSSVTGGWLTGGVYSPMLYFLLIPPVFAFVLANVKSGVVWFVLTMITFSVIWFIDEFRIAEPLYMIANQRDESLMAVLLPVATCMMIMMAIMIYEVNSFNLKKQLSQERNLLAFKATHDPLTALANREEFNTQIILAFNNARHSSSTLALVYIDLDGFKPINDTLGHHAGDEVLEVIAGRLRHIVRGTDTVARLGGDEFAIIFQGVGSEAKMEPILSKILASISGPIHLNNAAEPNVTVHGSLGVAFYDDTVASVETLCRNADAAMYKAKEEKNTWRFFQA
jgi:diguanylate cyclase (GGDEF)-like protein